MKQVEYLLRGKMYSACGWTHRQTQGERELLSCILMTVELLLLGISSGFPSAKHFALLGSQSIFDISQDSHVVGRSSHTSLPQRHLGRVSLDINPPLTSKEPFSAGVVREVS